MLNIFIDWLTENKANIGHNMFALSSEMELLWVAQWHVFDTIVAVAADDMMMVCATDQ